MCNDKKIIDYVIVSVCYVEGLVSLVRHEILNGYVPFGNIVKINDEMFMQAMVKYED